MRDGTVVLVRKGSEFGAFRIERQRADPDRVTYTWIARGDGGSVLDRAHANTRQGRKEDTRGLIEVGGMSVEWSVAGDGKGWLYYGRVPGSEPSAGDVLLCVTGVADFRGLDAADPRWEYRGALTDAPRTGR